MRKKTDPLRVKRRKRIAVWSFALIMAASIAAPFSGFLITAIDGAMAQETASAAAESNPRANLWRAVKGGVGGYSAVQGAETGVLINPAGNDWANFRKGPVFTKLPWVVAGMLALIVLYHLLHGKNRLQRRPSGVLVKRWSWFERLVHWVTAVSFIVLSITGLSMLLGRTVLLPMLSGIDGGKAAFAAWSQLAIQAHNVLGPVLGVGIVLMIVMWIWFNFPGRGDWRWIKAGGGLIGSKHPSAGRVNFGEKIWFWIICTFGLAVVITGLALVAPSYPQLMEYAPIALTRNLMQDANQYHVIAGLIWMAVAIGHIYIGTAGTEGALQGMATGYVTAEWAEQHHDLWFDKLRRKGKVASEPNRYSRGHNAVTQRSL
ncbi:formate dehydrogenase subunit gamma [Chromatiales bacterium (ex Bugula neritina AB1)]|nr:formate dehydrogenase subunit gamma [Chromatiales bacterium (ex Bugula neritina AB1)]